MKSYLTKLLFLIGCLSSQAYADNQGDMESIKKIVAMQQAEIQALKASVLPVGSIVAWHKSLLNGGGLPFGWIECSGQKIPVGTLAGKNTPDLNNGKRFLRGGTSSGAFEADQLQGHSHSVRGGGEHEHTLEYTAWSIPTNLRTDNKDGYDGWKKDQSYPTHRNINKTNTSGAHSHTLDGVIALGAFGDPRVGNETRPANMSVVWIMRII